MSTVSELCTGEYEHSAAPNTQHNKIKYPL